ncbi:MAG: SPOR domain-containing protein [Bradyrhizobium sp.]|nr:SPOR domain-containing protein [Bradyrhizobium sp.]
MADRFQDRPGSDGLDRLDPRGRGPMRGGDADPLAELARLIGQNDPFGGGASSAVAGGMSRANARVQPQPQRAAPDSFRAPMPPAPSPVDDSLAAGGPPPWMQSRPGRPEGPRLPPVVEPNFEPGEVAHPMQRFGAEPAPPQPQYRDEPGFDDREQEPARYDDALFGQLDTGGPAFQRQQPYPDDPYAFQDEEYDDGEEEEAPRRGNGLAKVAVFLALGVIGTGAAFAYRSYMGSSRSGDPPIIRADNSPTKILTPVPADGITKLPDRLGDQGEKMVSREETPVDVNTRSVSPRVVFPPTNQSSAAPAPASSLGGNDAMQMPPVASADTPPPASSGTMPAGEPRRIKTLSVRGDQADNGATGAAAAAATTAAPPKAMKGRNSPASANASANAPMPIAPQAPAPAAEKKMAAVAPTPDADAAPMADSGYLVSVSSQKSEADAQASFRALKAKYADAMGSYSAPVIKKVDLPGKGVMYRAMVGPFDTSEAANQFCKGLTAAGGQCFVPRK